MPDPISTGFAIVYGYASSIWGYVKWPMKQIVRAFQLNAKVAELEEKLSKLTEQPAATSPYRKCPQCGERDLRLQDRYRYRPDVFDNQRYFHEKWRCYTCGAIDEVNLPEPGG
jgi:uncharacterized protein with PIN domain